MSLDDKILRNSHIKKEDIKQSVRELKARINKNINITERQKRNISKDIKEIFGKELT